MAINSLTPASKGLSGMVSGMDTQSMVEQMLKGTQAKIDMKTQQKAVLAMKQGMYRDVAAQLKAFQNTFFSFTKPDTNLLSNGFFKTMNAVTDSKFYKAQASGDANVGKMTINNIKQMATNHKEVAKTAATGPLAGKVNTKAVEDMMKDLTNPDNTLNITIGADTVKVKVVELAGKSTNEITTILNDALKNGDGTTKGTVEFLNGKVQIFATDSTAAVGVSGSASALKMANNITKADGAASFNFNSKAALPKIEVNLDGISKSITFSPFVEQSAGVYRTANADEIAAQLNEGVKAAFGNGLKVAANGDKIEFTATNSSSKVTLTGESNVMSAVGIKSGLSNKIARGASIGSLNFKTPLSGNMQKFTINGVDFSFDNSRSLNAIIDEINESDAGVKINYDANTDRFSIESTVQGKLSTDAPFTMSQSEGNLLTSMFGVDASNTVSSGVLTREMKTTANFNPGTFNFAGGDVTISVMGVEKTYTLAATTNAKDLVDELNAKLAADFKSTVNGVEEPTVQFTVDTATGKVEMNSKMGEGTAQVIGEGLSALGYTTKVDSSTKLSDLGFEDFTYTAGGNSYTVDAKNTTLDQFMTQLSAASGGTVEMKTIGQQPFIQIAGVSIPMVFPEPAASKLFGAEVTPGTGAPMDPSAVFDSAQQVKGQNAIATVNGVEIERSSNNFTVDGVTITLIGKTDDASEVTVTQDTEKIFDTTKKFVEEYNKLVDSINELLGADTTYKAYPPLTAAQKANMSDKEIEAWEEKSKGGLLRGDSTLQGVLQGLRSTLYTKADGGIALYDLGIATNYFGTKDNLMIADEAALKAKIAENPNAIRDLFTDAEKGLATLMNEAIDKAAKASSVNPGSLVAMAGAKGMPSSDSTIARQMKLIDDSLKNLNNKYQSEYDRYWKQFNSMEQMIQKMNSQSSWLSQQFSG